MCGSILNTRQKFAAGRGIGARLELKKYEQLLPTVGSGRTLALVYAEFQNAVVRDLVERERLVLRKNICGKRFGIRRRGG